MKNAFAIIAALVSICTTGLAASQSERTLWVTFENAAGHRHRVEVRRGDAATYVRAFVEGKAPVAVPAVYAREWLGQAGVAEELDSIRIVRAELCRRASDCIYLRGLYAGRSPAL